MGGIVGTVLNEKKEPIAGAYIEVTQGGIKKLASVTDEEGNYVVKPLTPSRYDVTVKLAGYKTSRTKGVAVTPDMNTRLDFQLDSNTTGEEIVVISEYKQPEIETIRVLCPSGGLGAAYLEAGIKPYVSPADKSKHKQNSPKEKKKRRWLIF